MHALALTLSLTLLAAPPASPRRQAELSTQIQRRDALRAARARQARVRAEQAAAAELYYQSVVLPQQQAAAMQAWKLQNQQLQAQGIAAMGAGALQNAEINRRRLILQRQVSGFSSEPLPIPAAPGQVPLPFQAAVP